MDIQVVQIIQKGNTVMAVKDKCETKRVSVSLPLDTIEKLDQIASRHGITMTDAIRRAIATEAYIDSKIQEDNKILIQQPDNSLIEVVFR